MALARAGLMVPRLRGSEVVTYAIARFHGMRARWAYLLAIGAFDGSLTGEDAGMLPADAYRHPASTC